jgi:hypothetical protein
MSFSIAGASLLKECKAHYQEQAEKRLIDPEARRIIFCSPCFTCDITAVLEGQARGDGAATLAALFQGKHPVNERIRCTELVAKNEGTGFGIIELGDKPRVYRFLGVLMVTEDAALEILRK